MPFGDPNRILAAANADPEFRLAARYWDATLIFVASARALRVDIANGQVASCDFGDGPDSANATLVVTATDKGWTEFLAPKPRAFYQDLLGGAVGRHGFGLAGDILSMSAYYQASQRLFAIMRQLLAEKETSHATV